MTISSNWFFFAMNLEYIIVDDRNPYFSSVDGVLYDKNLKKIIEFPSGRQGVYQVLNGVEEIADYAFWASKIDHVELPESLEIIGEYAFGSSRIARVELPESLETIGNFAFLSCLNLDNIYIPQNVSRIGGGAFGEISVDIDKDNPFFQVIDGILYYQNKNEVELNNVLYILPEKYAIPHGVKKIGEYAFLNQPIYSIICNEELEEIADNAFDHCDNLSEIVWNSKLRYIGKYAFTSCDFSYLELPQGLEELGEYAFDDCPLKKIKMPDSIKRIKGQSLFEETDPKLIESGFFDEDYVPYYEEFDGIIASRNSYAAKWAEENGIAVEYTD